MITTENKYFLRIILLLYDAASFILRHIVVRELKKHGDDINNLLTKAEFENKLKHKLHFGKSQVDKLFPSNGKSDIQTWDSQMLAVVSLLIFRSTLSGDEKYHIKFIKLTRNNVAHKPSASYLEDDFVDEKEGIVKAITTLASTFDTTVQENCRKLISSYCSDLFDIQLAIKHLEEDTTNRELLRQILDAVNEKHELVRKDIQEHAEKIENKIHLTEKKICESQDTVLNSLNGLCLGIGNVESKVTESKETSSKELKQVNASLTNHIVKESEKVSQKVDSNNSLLQKLQNCQNEHAAKVESKLEELKQLFEQTSRTGSHCSKQIKFGTHTHLTVDGPTQEWINIVETVLKSVFDLLLNNVQEPGQNPETEKAVEEFLNFIKGFKGVELKAVERKCILLAFECLTYESLREFIEFINSNEFLSYLENIARALERDLKIPNHITISSEIPVSSLQLVVDDKSLSIKHESEKGIDLSFECTSIDGLDAFWCLFGKGEATPYIDKIAATLSSEVREQTSISTIVDLREFEDALTHLEATVNREKETVLFKPNEESPRQSPDLEPDIDTLKTRTALNSHCHDTELIYPRLHLMNTFQIIQSDLKNPNAMQDIFELESENEHMQGSLFSSYRQSGKTDTVAASYRPKSMKQDPVFCVPIYRQANKYQDSHTKRMDSPVNPLIRSYPLPSCRVIPFEAGKVGHTHTRLSYSTQGDSGSHSLSSSYRPRSVKQESEAKFGKASYTEDLKLSVEENYHDELTQPDPLYSAKNTKSIDSEHSEISGQSSKRLSPSFKQWEYHHDIDSAGTRYSKHFLRKLKEQLDEASDYDTRYSSEQRLRKRRLTKHEDEESEYNTRYSSEQPPRWLTEQANILSPHQLNRFSLVYQKKIPRIGENYAYGLISPCAILSRERLMIADYEELSIVNIYTGCVEQKKALDTMCSDIAVLPEDQVAVTLHWDHNIVILSTTDMSLIRSIPDFKFPSGITYRQDELYVVCYDKGPSVNILNLQGGLLRKVKCDEIPLNPLFRIAVSMDAQNLYITDYESLSRYSAHGQVNARYRLLGRNPDALALLDDGSLLVVSKHLYEMSHNIHTIHHISADLQQGYELKLDERSVRSIIGVDPVNNGIYVISEDAIKVYYMHKQGSQRQSDYKLTFGTADEKLSSMKAKRKLLSLNTDEKLSSFKPDMNLISLETDKKLTSYKAEKEKLSPH